MMYIQVLRHGILFRLRELSPYSGRGGHDLGRDSCLDIVAILAEQWAPEGHVGEGIVVDAEAVCVPTGNRQRDVGCSAEIRHGRGGESAECW
jgi:hypothetical protein